MKKKSKIIEWILSQKKTGTFYGVFLGAIYTFLINAKLLAMSLFRKKKVTYRKLNKIIKRRIGYVKLSLNRKMLKAGPIEDINCFEATIFSQFGEDGILDAIFCKIGTTNKYFVEFGAQDGVECNSRFLQENSDWSGLMMDGGDNPYPIKKEFITAENINDLFKKYDVPNEFDLLSIDIDGNDYWVWKAIKEVYSPRVVIIEYNSSLRETESKTIDYQADFIWDGTDYFGASLLALDKLAKQKGYTLVGCNKIGGNAFFVRDDQIKDNFIEKDLHQLYRPARYKKTKDGYGHPHSDRPMVEV